MTTCGGGSICEYDLVTLDDVQEPCVSMHGLCIACEHVKEIFERDPFSFKHDPPGKIFGIKDTTDQQKTTLWKNLKEKCNMHVPTSDELKTEVFAYVVSPDMSEFKRHLMIIAGRIKPPKKRRYGVYLLLFLDLALLADVWNTQIDLNIYSNDKQLNDAMIHDMHERIRKYNVQMFAVHYPREIPISIALYIQQLASTSSHIFKRSLRTLRTTTGCVEAVLERAINECFGSEQ